MKVKIFNKTQNTISLILHEADSIKKDYSETVMPIYLGLSEEIDITQIQYNELVKNNSLIIYKI